MCRFYTLKYRYTIYNVLNTIYVQCVNLKQIKSISCNNILHFIKVDLVPIELKTKDQYIVNRVKVCLISWKRHMYNVYDYYDYYFNYYYYRYRVSVKWNNSKKLWKRKINVFDTLLNSWWIYLLKLNLLLCRISQCNKTHTYIYTYVSE